MPAEPHGSSMWFHTKDSSEATLVALESSSLSLHPAAQASGAPMGPGYPRAPGVASSIISPPGGTEQLRSATQRPTAPASRESFWALGDCWTVVDILEVWKCAGLSYIWRRSFLSVWLYIQFPQSLSPAAASPLLVHTLMAIVTWKAPEKPKSCFQTSGLD